YGNNTGLHKKNKKHFQLIIGIAVGVLVILLVLFLASLVLLHYLRKKASQKRSDEKGISGRSTKHITGYSFGVDGNLMNEGTAYYINLSDLKEATNNFSKKIGKGSFGSVYYGKMEDGKEIAVKTMTNPSSHGNHQFATEVSDLEADKFAAIGNKRCCGGMKKKQTLDNKSVVELTNGSSGK
ncbi:hypothetical protein TSUD_161250, partial [Trifolium subterraneum]